MDRSEACLRAALVPGLTPRLWARLLQAWEARGERGPPRAWTASHFRNRLRMGPREAARLARALQHADPQAARARAARTGLAVHAWSEDGYPDCLRALPDPPPAVFVDGDADLAAARTVALTGGRVPTPYGLRVAKALAHDLARAGVLVVAGGQRGLDACVHEAALAAGGATVAALPCGVGHPHPAEHAPLFRRIVAAGGALVSEFPPDAPPRRTSWAQRDRVLAALAQGVVVVEGGDAGGALRVAGHALDLGRTVLAVPGPIDQPNGRGPLRLLREGAVPCGAAPDVFAALGWMKAPPKGLPAEDRRTLDAVHAGAGTAAEVAHALRTTEPEAAAALLALELKGLIAREAGRFVGW